MIEQLANSAIGGAGLDAMAAGRPVIGNARLEMFEGYFGQPSPICQAQNAEEVYAQLKRLVFDPGEREKIGALGRQFVEEYCSPKRAAQTCLERLQTALASDKELAARNGIGHGYYLQRCYDDRQALQSVQQALQTTKAELQASQQTTQAELQAMQAKLARYERSLAVRVARKLAGW